MLASIRLRQLPTRLPLLPAATSVLQGGPSPTPWRHSAAACCSVRTSAVTGRCCRSPSTACGARRAVLGTVLARCTTDRTVAAWRQLRAHAPALLQEHSPAAAPLGRQRDAGRRPTPPHAHLRQVCAHFAAQFGHIGALLDPGWLPHRRPRPRCGAPCTSSNGTSTASSATPTATMGDCLGADKWARRGSWSA